MVKIYNVKPCLKCNCGMQLFLILLWLPLHKSVSWQGHLNDCLHSPYRQFKLEHNTEITEISEEVIGNISFQNIVVNDTVMKRIHPSFIFPSKERLVNLNIENSHLEAFPFDLLSRFSRLKTVWLRNNFLTSIHNLKSETLQLLSISRNSLSEVNEDSWETPNLKYLDIGEYLVSCHSWHIYAIHVRL